MDEVEFATGKYGGRAGAAFGTKQAIEIGHSSRSVTLRAVDGQWDQFDLQLGTFTHGSFGGDVEGKKKRLGHDTSQCANSHEDTCDPRFA